MTVTAPPDTPRATVKSSRTQRIVTDCLYTGGGQVVVTVIDNGSSYTVTDDELGWRVLLSAGLKPATRPQVASARNLSDQSGLAFKSGSFMLNGVELDQLPAAVILVANTSQEWVNGAIASQRISLPTISTRTRVALETLFGPSKLLRGERILGRSKRSHQVAFLLPLQGGRNAIFEPVADRTDALASTFMKFSDIAQDEPDWPREALVENLLEWESADLVLLGEVATGISELGASLEPMRKRLLG